MKFLHFTIKMPQHSIVISNQKCKNSLEIIYSHGMTNIHVFNLLRNWCWSFNCGNFNPWLVNSLFPQRHFMVPGRNRQYTSSYGPAHTPYWGLERSHHEALPRTSDCILLPYEYCAVFGATCDDIAGNGRVWSPCHVTYPIYVTHTVFIISRKLALTYRIMVA